MWKLTISCSFDSQTTVTVDARSIDLPVVASCSCQIMKFEACQVIDFPKKKKRTAGTWKKNVEKNRCILGLLVCAKFMKIVNPGLKNSRTGFHTRAPETPRGCILAIHGDGIQKVLSCGHVVICVLASGSTSVSPFSNERRNDLRRWERGSYKKTGSWSQRKWFWILIHPTFNMTFGCWKNSWKSPWISRAVTAQ